MYSAVAVFGPLRMGTYT